MSPSESAALLTVDPAATAKAISDLTRNALQHSGTVDNDGDDLRVLVSSATRLYAACCQNAGHEIALDSTVSTTDAVILACALLRACGLNPFDLALWFSSGFGDPVRASRRKAHG
jgi:hypothetical protein